MSGGVPGIFSIEAVPEKEAEELLRLKPGIYQTEDRIRSVAIDDGYMWILDTMNDGMHRYKLKMS